VTGLSILEAANAGTKAVDQHAVRELGSAELSILLNPFDLKRLDSYASNMVDYHVIIDLLPTLSSLYFEKRLGDNIRLSAVQASILLALGSQRKTVEQVEAELQLPVNQTLALFIKIVRKISKKLTDIQKAAISAELPSTARASVPARVDSSGRDQPENWKPVETSIDDELKEAGDEVITGLKEKQREMINALDLSQYAIDNTSADWSAAESHVAKGNGGGKSTVVSVQGNAAAASKKRKAEEHKVDDVGKAKNKKSRRSIKKSK